MASDTSGARAAIDQHIGNNWTATPLADPGMRFDPQDTDPKTGKPITEWVRWEILWGNAFMDTQGDGGVNVLPGVVSASIFTKDGDGDGRLYELADTWRDLWNRAELSGVRFDAPSGPKPPRDDGHGWLVRDVTVAFEVRETV